MVAADVEVDEISHAAPRDAVEDVSRRAAQNQCESALREPAPRSPGDQEPDEDRDDGD